MPPLRRTLLVLIVAVALIARMSAVAAAVGVKILNGGPDSLARSPTEGFESSTTKKSLRGGIKKYNNKRDVDDGNYRYTSNLTDPEERFRMDLKTIEDTKLEKYLGNETKKLRAFKYLEKKKVDAWGAYVRLGGPNLADGSVRMKFWKAYGAWYDLRHYS